MSSWGTPDAVLRGALSGLKATAVMSVLFALHPDATVPPKVVTDNVFRAVGLRPVPGAWLPAHFAFGLTLGAVRARLAAPRIPFALTVWAAAYATALPALGLYPPLTRDHRRRAAVSLLAHVVFGAALRDEGAHLDGLQNPIPYGASLAGGRCQ